MNSNQNQYREIWIEADDGQRDEYPLSWVLSLDVIEHALMFFKNEKRPPTFVTWNNDSGDGYIVK